MEFFVHLRGETVRVRVLDGAVEVDGERVEIDVAPASRVGGAQGGLRSIRVGGRSLRVLGHRNGTGAWGLAIEGERVAARVLDPGEEAVRRVRRASGAGSGPAPLKAPMPGLVVRVEVEEGDEVGPGDALLIVEAMKMENELRATAAGRVARVAISPGEAVEKGQLLIEFEAEGGAPGSPAPEGEEPSDGSGEERDP